MWFVAGNCAASHRAVPSRSWRCTACPEQSRHVECLFPGNRARPSHRNLVRVRIDHDCVWPCTGWVDGATRLVASRLLPECSDCPGYFLDHPDEDSKSRDASRKEAARLAGGAASNSWIELPHLRATGVVEPEDAVAPLWSGRAAFAPSICSGRETDARAARSHGAFSKPELRRGQSPHVVSIWCPFCHAVLSSSKPHSGSALFPNPGWRCNIADGSADVPALPLGWWSCGAIRTAKAPHHRPSLSRQPALFFSLFQELEDRIG